MLQNLKKKSYTDLFIILFYVEIVISIKHLHQSSSTLNKFCRNMCNVKIGSGSSIFRVFLICTYYLKLRYIFSMIWGCWNDVTYK